MTTGRLTLIRTQLPGDAGKKQNQKVFVKGAAGIEPATAGSAILCSTAELYTLGAPSAGGVSVVRPVLWLVSAWGAARRHTKVL